MDLWEEDLFGVNFIFVVFFTYLRFGWHLAHNPGDCGNQPPTPYSVGTRPGTLWQPWDHGTASFHVSTAKEAAMSPHLLMTVGFAAHAAGMLR